MPQVSEIADILVRAGRESDPLRALHHLLEDSASALGASQSRLYLLDLTKTAYVQHAAQPPDANSSEISLLEGAGAATEDLVLRDAILAGEMRRGSTASGARSVSSRLIVPILRDRVCIGVFDFHSDKTDHFTHQHESVVGVAAVVAGLICEKEDAVHLLHQLQTPIDYRRGFDDFLDEVMLLVANASQMPIIALRELREDTLHCLRQFGFTDLTEEDLHLSPLADYPWFEKAVGSRELVIVSSRESGVKEFLKKFHLERVQSFVVVPVLVGVEVFGTLSFAVLCNHRYTTLEKEGLSAIANAVGVAVSKYRNFHAAV